MHKLSPAAKLMADEFAKAMESAKGTWKSGWNDGACLDRFRPQSALGHVYTGGNRIRLMCEKWPLPVYATIKQVNALGGKVVKGSHSIRLVYWKQYRKKDDDPDEAPRRYMKVFRVFNVGQTDLDVTRWTKGDASAAFEAAPPPIGRTALLEAAGKCVELDLDYGSNPSYAHHALDPKKCRVNMPKYEKWESEDRYFATLMHEMSHWAQHRLGIAQQYDHAYGSPRYARMEIMAEFSSVMLCSDLGIPFSMENSANYADNWSLALRSVKDEPARLMKICADAERCRDFVLQELRNAGLDGTPALQEKTVQVWAVGEQGGLF